MILIFICGVILGILSGFIPGLHSNTIVAALSSAGLGNNELMILIIALFPAHIVSSFIPAIFFGIPEENTVISVLPGHRMVLEGKGLVALKVVLISCLISALLCMSVFAFSLDFFPFAYGLVKPHMKYIVLILSLFFIVRSKDWLMSLVVFVAAGMVGYYALNSGVYDPFMPLFSGMFAIGAILNYKQRKIPEQKDEEVGFGFWKYIGAGVILGMFADLIPGVSSPSQVATFMTIFLPLNTLGFLAAISSVSVSEGIFSLATATSIGKSRIGTTVWLSKFVDVGENLVLLLPLFLLSMLLAIVVIYLLRKKIAGFASVDFSKANIVLGLYLLALAALLNGFTGVLIFGLASILGWTTIRLGVERTNLMGAVIVPTLIVLFSI